MDNNVINETSPSQLVKRYNERIHKDGMSSVESMKIMVDERNKLAREGKWHAGSDYGLLYPDMMISPDSLNLLLTSV
jgi:hypothetical protein